MRSWKYLSTAVSPRGTENRKGLARGRSEDRAIILGLFHNDFALTN
jgi:hypothetical protein